MLDHYNDFNFFNWLFFNNNFESICHITSKDNLLFKLTIFNPPSTIQIFQTGQSVLLNRAGFEVKWFE